MSPTSYRLPDWLGGHAVDVLPDEGGNPDWCVAMLAEQFDADGSNASITILREHVVEVRPPSIDDPSPLPIEIEDDFADACLFVDNHPNGAFLRLRGRNDRLVNQSSVYSAHEAVLKYEDLALIARALWQRANAIEATQ